MPPRIGAAAGPSANDVADGARFCSFIDWASRDPGEIFDSSGALVWRYTVDTKWPRVFPLTLFTPFFKADFVISNPRWQEVLRIHRLSGIFPRFAIIQDGQIVGRINYRNVVRTRVTLELAGGPAWNFRQRLFNIYFYGDSDTGQRLWIRVGPSKRRWNMLLPPNADDVRLLAALAFLHREYWRH